MLKIKSFFCSLFFALSLFSLLNLAYSQTEESFQFDISFSNLNIHWVDQLKNIENKKQTWTQLHNQINTEISLHIQELSEDQINSLKNYSAKLVEIANSKSKPSSETIDYPDNSLETIKAIALDLSKQKTYLNKLESLQKESKLKLKAENKILALELKKLNETNTADKNHFRQSITVLIHQLKKITNESELEFLKEKIVNEYGYINDLHNYKDKIIQNVELNPENAAYLEKEIADKKLQLQNLSEKLANFQSRYTDARNSLEKLELLLTKTELFETDNALQSLELELAIDLNGKAYDSDTLIDIKKSQQQLVNLEQAMLEAVQSLSAETNSNNTPSAIKQLHAITESIQKSKVHLINIAAFQEIYQNILAQSTDFSTRTFFQIKSLVLKISSSIDAFIELPLTTINNTPISVGSLVWVVAIFFIAIIFSKLFERFLYRIAHNKNHLSESSLFTVAKISHYIIISAAVIISFGTIGIDISKLALIAGALSVGIGFGLQSIFNNFISGLILLFERPLKVGDLIELESGVRGRIKSINVRSTQVTTWDNIDILVPNSEFISGRVTNYTFTNDLRRLHIPFGVAYGSDKELVKTAALEAAYSLPHTLSSKGHEADVWLVNYGDSSLDFELIVWVKGNKLPTTKSPTAMYLWELETALHKYGIEIPFPQRDLHLKTLCEIPLNKEDIKS